MKNTVKTYILLATMGGLIILIGGLVGRGVGATFGVAVKNFSTFCATALNGVLILLPGNGERQVTPLTTCVVEGSKICPIKIGLLLSQGFRTVVAAPSNA